MVHGPVYDTFPSAYLAVLRHIATEHQFTTAGAGRSSIEVINTSFTIADPINRTPYLAARRTNIVFAHAQALWYLTGRDDRDMIGYYAPRPSHPAIDGRLTGTAYGPRLFGPTPPDGRSQFDRAIELLRDAPDTTGAAMVVKQPDELSNPQHPDTTGTTLALQFLLRDRRLYLAASVRGTDAVVGLLCDVFSFTFIQEYTARLLDVAVGTYSHHVGAMHINTADLGRVNTILAEAHHPQVADPDFPAPAMPITPAHDLARVMQWEQALRTNARRLVPIHLDRLAVPVYWQQVLALFEVYRQIAHQRDLPVAPDAMAALRPGHRWLVAARWPDRMPPTITTGHRS